MVGLLADLRSLVLDMRSLDVQNNNIRCPETGVPTPAQSTWGAKHRLTHPAGVRSSGVSTSLYFRSLPGSQRNFPRLRVLRGDSPALALSLGTRVQTSPGGRKPPEATHGVKQVVKHSWMLCSPDLWHVHPHRPDHARPERTHVLGVSGPLMFLGFGMNMGVWGGGEP